MSMPEIIEEDLSEEQISLLLDQYENILKESVIKLSINYNKGIDNY